MVCSIIFSLLISLALPKDVHPLGTNLCKGDSCIKIILYSDKQKYSNEESIVLTLEFRNNSDGEITLPTTFANEYYRPNENHPSKDFLIFQIQKLNKKKYTDYEYPPDNIELLELYEWSENSITLHPGQSFGYKAGLMLFTSMSKGKYRLRTLYYYSSLPDCSHIQSNWFYFSIR